MGINFSKRYKDYAIFHPAVSEMYVRHLSNKNPKRPNPIPVDDLNFMNPKSKLFYLPNLLYSAGQAAKTNGMAIKKDMMSERNRKHTTVIGDSGGYQIQTNAIKFKGDETRKRMMTWLENNCDWSMVLDFPVGGINMGNVDQHTNRLISEGEDIAGFCESLGFSSNDIQKLSYATCLKQTLINNDYFVKHRTPGKTKFLNVIQGRTVEESDIWYEHVKHFPFEGWALASHHKENFEMLMKRVISMRDDGLLTNKDWMHILGVGKLANGCIYTSIQRCIREDVNPRFTISYDVSSPFTTAAFGNLFIGYILDNKDWVIVSEKMDGREYLPGGSKAHLPFLDEVRKLWDNKGKQTDETDAFKKFVETEVGKRLIMSEVCVNEDPKYTATWDVVTYALMMNHNLQVHLEAVFQSQDFYDAGDTKHVPPHLLRLKELIPEIWKSETPYDLISKYREDLNALATETANSGIPVYTDFHLAPISEHNDMVEKFKNENKGSAAQLSLISDIFV